MTFHSRGGEGSKKKKGVGENPQESGGGTGPPNQQEGRWNGRREEGGGKGQTWLCIALPKGSIQQGMKIINLGQQVKQRESPGGIFAAHCPVSMKS